MFANLKDQRPKTKDQRPKTKDQRPKTKFLSLRAEKGFTLIELSLVIVIIGLIVAGVVGGQSLIEKAKLRNVITDIEKVKVGINTFRLEYGALPGDIRNASSYWPGVGDGNGDKIIAPHGSNEAFIFWVHLSRAGLFPSDFSGTTTNPPTIGYDIPEGPFPETGYSIARHHGPPAFGIRRTAIMYRGSTGNSLHAAGAKGGALDAKGAYSIDVKIDDGMANTANNKSILSTGRAYSFTGPDVCTQGNFAWNQGVDQEYQLADNTKHACWMFFWIEGAVY